MAASLTECVDLTQCSKCHQHLQSPRSLQCLHSYCTTCLEDLVKGNNKVKCVECSEEYDLPSGGLREWQPLAIVQRLTEQKAMQMALMTEEAIHCTACIDDEGAGVDKSDQPVAVARCAECDDFLCQKCVDIHKRQRTMKHHPVSTLDELRRGNMHKTCTEEQKMCIKHKDGVLQFYCDTCDVPICRQCVVEAHKYPDHKHAELRQIAKKKTDELQQLQESCKTNEDEAVKALQEIRKVKRDFEQAVTEAGVQIKSKVEKMKTSYLKRLEEAQKASEEELNAVKENSLQAINSADHKLTSIISRVSSAKMITKSLKESGSDFAVTSDYKQVKVVLQEAIETLPSSIICPGKNLTHVTFLENVDETSETVALGTIRTHDTRPIRDVFNGALKMEFGNVGSGKISGAVDVTVTPSGDIAVTDYCTAAKVNIFDPQGAFKSAFNVNVGVDAERECNPRCIEVGPDNLFYVTDYASPFVKIFDLQGSYKRYFHTVTPEGVAYDKHGSSQLAGLAIDAQQQVLVGNLTHNFISCHSLDGKHRKSIAVKIAPWVLAVTSKGHIVISSFGSVIQIIDESGKILTNLQTPHGYSSWTAAGVVVSKKYCVNEDDEDEIFVADRSECAIYRYSISGHYSGCVTKDVSDTYGVALSADEKELFVADWSSVKCFEMISKKSRPISIYDHLAMSLVR